MVWPRDLEIRLSNLKVPLSILPWLIEAISGNSVSTRPSWSPTACVGFQSSRTSVWCSVACTSGTINGMWLSALHSKFLPFLVRYVRELLAGLVMSWIRGIPDLSESLVIDHQFSLCHCCGVVLLVEVLLLFVEVDQFLVQRLIEQLEILRTFVDIAVFPEQVLSSADVVQRIVDFVVA